MGFSALITDNHPRLHILSEDKRSPGIPTQPGDRDHGSWWKGDFSVLITDTAPDVQFMGNGQMFSRYTYVKGSQ